VIQKGSRRGPYSSAGSVRSFGSYNSYSSKKSYGSNSGSVSSKAKSNYSYNSYKFRWLEILILFNERIEEYDQKLFA
jgi:hypothetical protein